MAQPNKAPKTMSSRLATMKFMQRSAASQPSSPSTPAEPSSKRQRLSNGSFRSTPGSTPRSDAQVLEDALSIEEHKRAEALEREGAARGETKWYLNLKEPSTPVAESPLRIVAAGYSTLDARDPPQNSPAEMASSRPSVAGRRSFGKFSKAVKQTPQHDPDSSPASDSDESDLRGDDEDDEGDDPTGAKSLIAQARRDAGEKARTERQAKRKAEQSETLRLAEERRSKNVKLNQLNGISSGNNTSQKKITCHRCGQTGHKAKDCKSGPQQRSRER